MLLYLILSQNFMKKLLWVVSFFILLVIIFWIYKFNFTNDDIYIESEKWDLVQIDKIVKQKKLEDSKKDFIKEKPKWINSLPEYSFNNIETTENSYNYSFKEEEIIDWTINRLIEYKKTDNDKYKWTMKLVFSSKQDSFIENIPKSFAKDISLLSFSIEPSRVINPDPIVEFKNIKNNIEIKSKQIIEEKDLEIILEKQIIDKESKICENIKEKKESLACQLKLIAKYRDTKALEQIFEEENLYQEDITKLSWAVIFAVKDNNISKCKLIKNIENKNLCYEYAYQVLVEECDNKKGIDYRNCVRNMSSQLPSMETQRLFCYHISDKQMYNECMWNTPISVCDEIKNEERKMMCQLNIARTKKSIKICQKIKEKENREVCYAVLWADKLDQRYCDIVKDDYLKAQCELKIAIVKNDKKICDDIKHIESRDLCYSNFMIKEDIDNGICEKINDSFLKETCQFMLAIKSKDIKKCDSYSWEEDYMKNFCYIGIAWITKNKDICKKIKDLELQKTCLDIFKKKIPKEENNFSMNCSDVTPPICPRNNEGWRWNKKVIKKSNWWEIRCSYYTSKSAWYPLYGELHFLNNKKYGEYKMYYKSWKIRLSANYIEDRADKYRIECTKEWKLLSCKKYDNWQALGLCKP